MKRRLLRLVDNPHPHEERLPPRLSQWLIQSLTRWTATYAILQGIAIILGGRQRWVAKALQVALSVPGAPTSWGIVLALFGVIVLWCTFNYKPRLALLGMLGIGAWAFFFALALIPAVIEPNSRITSTGIGTYIYVGVGACLLGYAYLKAVP